MARPIHFDAFVHGVVGVTLVYVMLVLQGCTSEGSDIPAYYFSDGNDTNVTNDTVVPSLPSTDVPPATDGSDTNVTNDTVVPSPPTTDVPYLQQASRSVFIRWGHRECPAGATKLYTGYAAGGYKHHSGSGANTLCLHPDPTYLDYDTKNQNGALLFGTEYHDTGVVDKNHDGDAVCTVCMATGVTWTQWGRHECPNGQRTEYQGYIMANHYQFKKSEFVCVDQERQVTSNNSIAHRRRKAYNADHNGNLWSTTEFETGSLPGDVFLQNYEATCAQCTDETHLDKYVRWGHRECPAGATKLYTGYAASGYKHHSGSGANTLCLHPDPTYLDHNAGDQNGALLFGTEYHDTGAADMNHDGDAVCTVCLTKGTTWTQWGRHECPRGQRAEYQGYIMANHYQFKKSEFVCVDQERQVTSKNSIAHRRRKAYNADHNGNMWSTTEFETGSLPGEVFLHNYEATCAQCTDETHLDKYVRWGHRDCPAGATKLYTGYAASGSKHHSGSGANTLCLHPDPTYLDHNAGDQNGALLLGTEYQNTGAVDANHDRDAVCTVCLTNGATYTQWGRHECPSDQRTEYQGYIMANHYTFKKSEFVCVDQERQVTPQSNIKDHNGNLWYTTEYEAGSLPGDVFSQNYEATCAQCTIAAALY